MAVGYNERAWAADLIALLSASIGEGLGPVKRAGGEYSLSGEGSTLFPDVLLFGDEAGVVPICGWELKLPDTEISDLELHANAREKASRLQTKTYVVWNFATAELWSSDAAGEPFERQESWTIPGIAVRRDVRQDVDGWKPIAIEILNALVELHDRGTLLVPSAVDVIGGAAGGLVSDLSRVLEPAVAEAMAERAGSDQDFRDRALYWWGQHRSEFSSASATNGWNRPLAGSVVSLWINRFLLVHLLRSLHEPVASIAKGEIVDLTEVCEAFHSLPETTDFAPVFSEQLGETAVPPDAWAELLAFNVFLGEMRLESAAEAYGNVWLEEVAAITSRRAVGQFKTPRGVADLLVALTVKDVRNDKFWDPCCGSGTIARAMFDRKRSYGVSVSDAYGGVWLSDKFATPLQAAQMTMVDATAIGEVVRVFSGDVFETGPGDVAEFADPVSGERFEEDLPSFDAIATNTPFVRFEQYVEENPNAMEALRSLQAIDADASLDSKSDLYAYVLARLTSILDPGATLGLITSNSWLGTGWGRDFQLLVRRHFDVRSVTISGRGRWFNNADVVTVMLVLERRPHEAEGSRITQFATTLVDLEDLSAGDIESLAAEIALTEADGMVGSGRARVRRMDANGLSRLRDAGLSLNAAFADVAWLSAMESVMVDISELATVARGERRGWNAMFYPDEGHGIESEFIVPALRSASSQKTLLAMPDADAFSCDVSLEELAELEAEGALAWIQRFENGVNQNGEPLTKTLARGSTAWYSMPRDVTADFVTSMNPGKRLFYSRFLTPAFVDQRLIRISCVDGVDVDLLHALLNTSPAMYFIEATGFGRGLGALDLTPTNLRLSLRVFNPAMLSSAERSQILEAFQPILERDVLSVPDELGSADRLAFESVVGGAYGVESEMASAREALLELTAIRFAAVNSDS